MQVILHPARHGTDALVAQARFSEIVDAVAAEFEIRRTSILSDRREFKIALARHVCMALAERTLSYSLPRIGRLVNRDHTTVLHGIRRIRVMCVADPAFAARIDALAARLQQTICAPGQECTDPGSEHCRCHRSAGHRAMERIEQTQRSNA